MKQEDARFLVDMASLFPSGELDRLQGDINSARKDNYAGCDDCQKLIKVLRSAKSELSKYGKIKKLDNYPEKPELEKLYEAYVQLEVYIMKEGKKANETLQKEKVEKIIKQMKK